MWPEDELLAEEAPPDEDEPEEGLLTEELPPDEDVPVAGLLFEELLLTGLSPEVPPLSDADEVYAVDLEEALFSVSSDSLSDTPDASELLLPFSPLF